MMALARSVPWISSRLERFKALEQPVSPFPEVRNHAITKSIRLPT
jgi:hypothetical protein